MKKIIITGAPRTGTTALATLLTQSSNILVTNELALFDNNPNRYYFKKQMFLSEAPHTNHVNARLLRHKGLTEKDIDDFFVGNFKNKGPLEFFGDKYPTYCTGIGYCDHLVEVHSDAYFIFTYRNPCAVLSSFLKRTQVDRNARADWYFEDIEKSLEKIITYNTNWSKHIFPRVEKKIIIDYDYYINNAKLLINDLSKFLNTTIDIKDPDRIQGHTEYYDKGFRRLYEHPNPDEYKDNFTPEEINFVNEKTKDITKYIEELKLASSPD
jgi:hypothetical protein